MNKTTAGYSVLWQWDTNRTRGTSRHIFAADISTRLNWRSGMQKWAMDTMRSVGI